MQLTIYSGPPCLWYLLEISKTKFKENNWKCAINQQSILELNKLPSSIHSLVCLSYRWHEHLCQYIYRCWAFILFLDDDDHLVTTSALPCPQLVHLLCIHCWVEPSCLVLYKFKICQVGRVRAAIGHLCLLYYCSIVPGQHCLIVAGQHSLIVAGQHSRTLLSVKSVLKVVPTN